MVDLDLKEIVHELGDVAWCEGKNFEDWVEPRVNAILQALAERDALKAELEKAKAMARKAQELAEWHLTHRTFAESRLEAARKQEPIIIRTMDGFEFLKTYEIGTKLYAIPVPAQQSAEVTPDIIEAAHEVTRALTALRHTRDAFEIGGLIRSDINAICDVMDVTASKLFQIAKGGENDR